MSIYGVFRNPFCLILSLSMALIGASTQAREDKTHMSYAQIIGSFILIDAGDCKHAVYAPINFRINSDYTTMLLADDKTLRLNLYLSPEMIEPSQETKEKMHEWMSSQNPSCQPEQLIPLSSLHRSIEFSGTKSTYVYTDGSILLPIRLSGASLKPEKLRSLLKSSSLRGVYSVIRPEVRATVTMYADYNFKSKIAQAVYLERECQIVKNCMSIGLIDYCSKKETCIDSPKVKAWIEEAVLKAQVALTVFAQPDCPESVIDDLKSQLASRIILSTFSYNAVESSKDVLRVSLGQAKKVHQDQYTDAISDTQLAEEAISKKINILNVDDFVDSQFASYLKSISDNLGDKK